MFEPNSPALLLAAVLAVIVVAALAAFTTIACLALRRARPADVPHVLRELARVARAVVRRRP
ncbi:hypothetical protein [Streptomyces sp. 8N616]|uniref:hypothetical protein n=1 Tax=Streptomyces sp. 8N616 TaxID=3457414 RepID=UPI003FD3E6CF